MVDDGVVSRVKPVGSVQGQTGKRTKKESHVECGSSGSLAVNSPSVTANEVVAGTAEAARRIGGEVDSASQPGTRPYLLASNNARTSLVASSTSRRLRVARKSQSSATSSRCSRSKVSNRVPGARDQAPPPACSAMARWCPIQSGGWRLLSPSARPGKSTRHKFVRIMSSFPCGLASQCRCWRLTTIRFSAPREWQCAYRLIGNERQNGHQGAT